MRGALSILHVLLALALSPLLLGVINRTKAAFGGRRGVFATRRPGCSGGAVAAWHWRRPVISRSQNDGKSSGTDHGSHPGNASAS